VRENRLSLSKSLFLRGLQCHKSLYLDRYHPDLRDEVALEKNALFESGKEVGILARQLFPGGMEIAYEGNTPEEQIRKTAEEIAKGTEILYEAAFFCDGVFMKADILRNGPQGWELYEVKASVRVEDVHLDDVALQQYVLTGSGIDVARAFLVHINNQYVRQGAIEVDELFAAEEITEAVKARQGLVMERLAGMREMLKGNAPEIDIGEYCDNPYRCDFQGYCWRHIPEDSVFDLKQRGVKPFDLYREGLLHFKDIPPERLKGRQLRQFESFLEKKEFIDHDAVRQFLDSLWYPIYFLDFETFAQAVPPFDGLRPYQMVPYQYSLHFIEEKGDLGHHEFLAGPNVDPRFDLTQKLLSEIPVTACVLAYNAAFERGRLRELADLLPEHSEKIGMVLKNMRDLMIPFRKQHVYHWEMKGSASQKAVLPVLVPGLSYEGMEVADGGMAMTAYRAMCESQDPAEVARIRTALLEYCKLDTLGMVKILDRLRAIA
jgi:hypothetical protein